MKRILALCAVLSLTFAMATPADDPFYPSVTYKADTSTVLVTFQMPDPAQHIYDDMLMCTLGAPTAKPATSSLDSDGRIIYEGLATFEWAAKPAQYFTLSYQGCDATQCYMPQDRDFTITVEGEVVGGKVELPQIEPPQTEVAGVLDPPLAPTPAPVATERKVAGFVEAADFVAFLRGDTAVAGEVTEPTFFDDPKGWVAANGIWLLIAIVFIGGVALNLTPCVLPMMPINLAIIGAGAAGGSRAKGALRGGAYGLGIALAYGVLALIPVLTGAAFGTIQAAWWFNAAIAVVFVALALALFDVFMIDFTRFSGTGSGKQGTIAAFIAGAVSAVLAGACVAPVLIAVLLLTADGYASGSYWMLCLPFILGLGMAAPWPIAGAGLSFLPKPGAWMVWVKKIFGIVVLLFAAYYGWTAVKTLMPYDGLDGANLPAIEAAIAEAKAEGKPILLDFWGTACKACDEMERDTFPNEAVQQELARFTFLKVRMDLSDRAIRETQKRFDIQGLPTYIVIE